MTTIRDDESTTYHLNEMSHNYRKYFHRAIGATLLSAGVLFDVAEPARDIPRRISSAAEFAGNLTVETSSRLVVATAATRTSGATRRAPGPPPRGQERQGTCVRRLGAKGSSLLRAIQREGVYGSDLHSVLRLCVWVFPVLLCSNF
jgi:hypothetical protein